MGIVTGIDTENRLKYDEGIENSQADGREKSKIKERHEKVERRLQTTKQQAELEPAKRLL